jgi:predicted ATPase
VSFADRGIPDTLCYARLIGLRDEQAIVEACEQYRYAKTVFLAPAWKEIYETDAERKQDFTEAARTAELMAEVYQECGYEVMELPRSAPAARADFILDSISVSGVHGIDASRVK